MRRATVTALLFALLVALALPSATIAAPGQSAEQLKAQLERLKAETKRAGSAFDNAYWRLDESEARIAKLDRQIARSQVRLAAALSRLNSHAASIYRRGSFSAVEFLVGSSNFEDFVSRLDYMRRVGAADAQSVAEVKRIRAELVAERASLVRERKTAAKALSRLRSERDRLQAKLKSKQSEFLRVKAELDAVRGGPNRPDGVASVAGPNGMVFPVHGSYYYSDTWGASRGGGRRRHKGTDIMAPTGTPCVAVLSGTVSSKSGGLGGKTIWLTADNGWQFYYAHLDGWAVRSGHVQAGQIIGYVGSTGNAAGGAPHLHFQIEPHGGPVNPYPYLRAME